MFFSLVVNNLVKMEARKDLEEGIDLVTKATKEDLNHNYDEALLFYTRGVQSLLTTVKYDHTMTHKNAEVVRLKCSKYLERADAIKAYLKDQEKTMATKLATAITAMDRPGDLNLSKVIGLRDAKEKLINAIIVPFKYPLLLSPEKRKPAVSSKGILIIGPCGSGKSLLARAIAAETDNVNFLELSAEKIELHWLQGQFATKLVVKFFEFARSLAPLIIFIDSVEEICSTAVQDDDEDEEANEKFQNYQKFCQEFHSSMAQAERDQISIQVIGTTSTPSALGVDILQIFGQIVETKLPKNEDRIEMIRRQLNDFPHNLTPLDFVVLGRRSKGRSGADLKNFVQQACLQPIRRIQVSTHFKKIETTSNNQKFIPCSPETGDAIKINWMDIPSEQLGDPKEVTMDDLLNALSRSRPAILDREGELKDLRGFVKKFENKKNSPINECAVV